MINLKKLVMITPALIFAPAIFALSLSGNLGEWRKASYSEKYQLCETMVYRLNRPGLTASAICSCISETAGDGGLDFMKINETAAACDVILTK